MAGQLWLASVVACAAAMPVFAETLPVAVTFQNGAISQSLTGTPGDPAQGMVVMTTNALGNCVACHQIDALPDVQFPGNIAPPLDGVGDRWAEADLRGIVVNAKMMFPDSFMPAFYKTEGFVRPGAGFSGKAPDGPMSPVLTAAQVEDVVAYLITLKD